MNTRQKLPVAVLTQVSKDARYPAKDLPLLEMHILFDLAALKKLVQDAEETGRGELVWNVATPKIKMTLETVDRAKVKVMESHYAKAAMDDNRSILHLTGV